MDELEKKKLSSEDNEALPTSESNEMPDETLEKTDDAELNAQDSQASDSDDLNEELEQLREMFQSELDKAKESAENGELIQELDEIEADEPTAEEPEINPEDLCQCCGEKIRDTSFGDDYPYCSDCRELMKANPLNSLGVIMLVVMVFIAGFSLSRFASNYKSWEILLDADNAYSNHYMYSAVNGYQSYFSSVDKSQGVSMKAVKNLADAYNSFGSLNVYSYAKQVVDEYFSDFARKLPWNKKYTLYDQKSADMEKVNTILSENFQEMLSGAEVDYKEMMKKANALIEENKNKEDAGQYTIIYLEYIKYIIMVNDSADYSEQLEQLKNVEKADNGELHSLYYVDIINLCGKIGDVETAKEYFEKLIEINCQDPNAYMYYADVYRYADKQDADKILEIAKEAAAKCGSSTFPSYYKIYTYAYLLQGKFDDAYSNMEQYLQATQNYGSGSALSDYNLYALCALAAGKDDAYKSTEEMLKQNGVEISQLVKKYKKGKLTIEQILSDKGGEL